MEMDLQYLPQPVALRELTLFKRRSQKSKTQGKRGLEGISETEALSPESPCGPRGNRLHAPVCDPADEDGIPSVGGLATLLSETVSSLKAEWLPASASQS